MAHRARDTEDDDPSDGQRVVRLPGQLTDGAGNGESHPPAPLMEFIGLLIGKYEDEHVPELGEGCIVGEEPSKK
ncbi:MAG: hypothetical protein ABI318_20785 [Chthoniobacteraceae bacterium]